MRIRCRQAGELGQHQDHAVQIHLAAAILRHAAHRQLDQIEHTGPRNIPALRYCPPRPAPSPRRPDRSPNRPLRIAASAGATPPSPPPTWAPATAASRTLARRGRESRPPTRCLPTGFLQIHQHPPSWPAGKSHRGIVHHHGPGAVPTARSAGYNGWSPMTFLVTDSYSSTCWMRPSTHRTTLGPPSGASTAHFKHDPSPLGSRHFTSHRRKTIL